MFFPERAGRHQGRSSRLRAGTTPHDSRDQCSIGRFPAAWPLGQQREKQWGYVRFKFKRGNGHCYIEFFPLYSRVTRPPCPRVPVWPRGQRARIQVHAVTCSLLGLKGTLRFQTQKPVGSQAGSLRDGQGPGGLTRAGLPSAARAQWSLQS